MKNETGKADTAEALGWLAIYAGDRARQALKAAPRSEIAPRTGRDKAARN